MGTMLNDIIIQLVVIIAHLSNDCSNCCLQTSLIYRSRISNIKYVKSILLDIVAKTHNNALNLYSGHVLHLH